jgi:uncharacterized protein YuzE
MEQQFEVRLDDEANALYFRIKQGEVARTVEYSENVFIDLDEAGDPIGIEVIQADQFLSMLREHGGGLKLPQFA